MDQAARERIEREVTEAASQRFPDAVQGIVVLQHAIGRSMKPGELTIRVLITPDWPGGQQRPLRDFGERHRPEIEQFRRDLSQQFPRARRLEFTHAEAGRSRVKPVEAIVLLLDRDPGQHGQRGGTAASDLTPVMARLGPAELDIVDTLISAGIAPNRAEAIRWALARISERPAYAQLRERTLEIERLKSEF
jgi:hypothetical protein